MRRHQWNLSTEQQQRLQAYLDQYPVLKALYHAKHQLMRLLLLKTLKVAHVRRYLPQLRRLLISLPTVLRRVLRERSQAGLNRLSGCGGIATPMA
jgi:hypothetical protein